MTRKDYKLLAEVLRQVRQITTENTTINTIIEMLSRALIQDNPRFDADKFFKATF